MQIAIKIGSPFRKRMKKGSRNAASVIPFAIFTPDYCLMSAWASVRLRFAISLPFFINADFRIAPGLVPCSRPLHR